MKEHEARLTGGRSSGGYRVKPGDRRVKIVEGQKAQHVRQLEADDPLIFFIHPADDGERRIGSGFVKPLKRREFDRLVFRHALRAGVTSDRLQQRRNQRDGQADFQRCAGNSKCFR